MTVKREGSERFSLARWSQRKLESAQTSRAPADTRANVPAAPSQAPAPIEAAPAQAPAATAGAASGAVDLPPVESLTFDSDFTAFLRPEVDPDLKRAALKQLFRDPRFNVMDGLDTYIDDYTKPDPIPPDMLAELVKRFDFTQPPPAAVVADRDPARSGAAPAATEPPRLEAAPSGAAAATGPTSESSPEIAPSASAQTPDASTVAQDPAHGSAPTGSTDPGAATDR